MKMMDHPSIIKLKEVYDDVSCGCLVMERLGCGNLIQGLERRLKERGQINCFNVVRVACQIASLICYLRERNVVHRDIKGDKFLMGRKDITSRKCNIVLTDF